MTAPDHPRAVMLSTSFALLIVFGIFFLITLVGFLLAHLSQRGGRK